MYQKEGNGNLHTVFAHSEQVCEFTSEYISSYDHVTRAPVTATIEHQRAEQQGSK